MSNSDEPADTPAPPSSENARHEPRMVRADMLAGLVFVVLGALILYGSWTMPRLEVRRIHPMTVPGLTPGLLSAALIMCGMILALRSLRSRVAGGWKALGEALISDGARRALAVIALALIYTLGLVGWLPFWAATAMFVFAFIATFELWLTTRPRRTLPSLAWALGLAIVASAAVTFAFTRLFLVRLP